MSHLNTEKERSEMAEMSKILVTGGTGNVGKHVVSTLVTRGHDVRAVLRDPGRASLPRSVEVVRGGPVVAGDSDDCSARR